MQLQRRLDDLSLQLKHIEDESIKGDIIRSKIKWIEEGERSTKFFFGLEKQNYVKKNMRKIEVDNVVISDPKLIQQKQKLFYEDLYQSKQHINFEIPETFFNSDKIETLDDAEKETCDRPITLEECEKVMKTFKNDKSPGNDGLTYEFYKTFWNAIRKPLIDCYQYAFEKNELSTSQKQSIITLLEKTGKNRLDLGNWRPISLLNFDYKLLTKLLSSRMQEYLPRLINSNQAGFVKGRFIGDTIRIIQDLIEYTHIKNLPGLLLFIDFEKAFDTIEWKFIWKVFETFNFGNSYIKWLKIIYNKPQSCIINNGHSGPYFKLQRGVRQGDPLSPYIFILAIELLAIKIRSDNEILGFNIRNSEVKLALYADDITIAVQDLKSAEKVFDVLKAFSKDSGLKVNIKKSEGMWLGTEKNNNSEPFGIKWPNTPIKALGICFSYNKQAAINKNYVDKIESLLKQLHWWKARNLSLSGKILVVKALSLSRFALISSVISVPKDIISKVNTIIYNFVWNGKTDKVKRKIIEQDFPNGGLKMLDFETMIKGAKIKWIKRYLESGNGDWKILFEEFCGKENLNVFLRSNFDYKELPSSVPDYYLDSIRFWMELKSKQGLIHQQFLWYNKNIKINNKTIYCQSLFQSGVWKVSDLYCENRIIPFETLLARGVKRADFLIWRGILQSIPENMKHYANNIDTLDLGWFHCDISNKVILIDKASEKQIKSAIRTVSLKQMDARDYKAQKKFESIHGNITEEEWKDIYMLPRNLKIDNFTKDLQYKILLRFLPTNKLLYQMKKIASNKCIFCNLQIDSLEHSLWDCLIIKEFWTDAFDIWNSVNLTEYVPSLRAITFGLLDADNPFINVFILQVKKFLQEVRIVGLNLSVASVILYFKRIIICQDPYTEKIINFIRTREREFTLPFVE